MIVRLHRRALNLAHMALAEDLDTPEGGMRIFIVGNLKRDLGKSDADRLRRRFRQIDPEPLEGETLDISGSATVSSPSPRPTPRRPRRRQSGA